MPLDSEHTAIVEGWRRHREAASRPILLRDDFGAVWLEVSARHRGVDGSARLEANGWQISVHLAGLHLVMTMMILLLLLLRS